MNKLAVLTSGVLVLLSTAVSNGQLQVTDVPTAVEGDLGVALGDADFRVSRFDGSQWVLEATLPMLGTMLDFNFAAEVELLDGAVTARTYHYDLGGTNFNVNSLGIYMFDSGAWQLQQELVRFARVERVASKPSDLLFTTSENDLIPFLVYGDGQTSHTLYPQPSAGIIVGPLVRQGTTALLGMPAASQNAGAVYRFAQDENHNWSQAQIIGAPAGTTQFGTAMILSNGSLYVSGSGRIFQYSPGEDGNWTLVSEVVDDAVQYNSSIGLNSEWLISSQ